VILQNIDELPSFHFLTRHYHVLRNGEGNVQVHSRRGQDGGPQTRVAAGYDPRKLAAVGIAPQDHGRTAFRQEPACQSANFGDRLRKSYLCSYLPIGPVKYPLNLTGPALKLEWYHQRRGIESRPIASARNPRKLVMAIGGPRLPPWSRMIAGHSCQRSAQR